jgi:hypothetical protein
MSQAADRRTQAVEQALALARDVAGELGAIILTHYPDAETLDTFRPGTEDLASVTAVNRAVAAELAGSGVQVLVQVADRAAFRRWMDEREDTPANRLAWRARGKLLHGAAALAALGLDPGAIGPRPKLGKAPGPLAERLLRAFMEDEAAEFEEFAHDLMAAGRDEVLDLALRMAGERDGEETADELAAELMMVAEGAEIGPSGWAELVALPVALPPGALPDAAAMGYSLVASGILPESLEIRFLPAWRSPDALAQLHPAALRRVLVDMVAGREPADLEPAAPYSVSESGFALLLGLQIDWSIPAWEEIAAHGLPPGPADEEEADQAIAFDRWRAAIHEMSEGCVPLALVPPSEVEAEIAEFLAEAGAHTGGIEQIHALITAARREAAGEEVVCRPEVIGNGLELSLYTQEGRFLDSLTLSAEQMPARAEEMPRLIASFVRLVKDAPGR